MLRVMLTILIVARISPAKCQENTESIVETTSSRGTTGTIFNDLVDAEFVGEGVTGFSGFIPDDTESVNTEGTHELKDSIQTAWPRQNFTTFTTPVTLLQTENIVENKETISETDDITFTNTHFKVSDKYNVQTTTNNPFSAISTTISYNERTLRDEITEFTTKQSSHSGNINDNLDDVNSDYTYDDIYGNEDDKFPANQKDVNNQFPIEDPPLIDNIFTRETTSQPEDASNLLNTSSNDNDSYISDAANEGDLNHFAATTEETISTKANNLDQNSKGDHKEDEFSTEYDENIITATESILTTTSKIPPEEMTFGSQSINFPLDFDTEESIITIPSILMEQITSKRDLLLGELEENSSSNTNPDIMNSDEEANDDVLNTEKGENTEAPMTLTEETVPEQPAIDEEIIEFQDLETPEYEEMNGENADQDAYDKTLIESTSSSFRDFISSLNLQELINGRRKDKNTFLLDTTTEETYSEGSFISRSTFLPFTTGSRDSEQPIFDSTSTSKELSAVEIWTSTKVNDNQTLKYSEEITTSTAKKDSIYSSHAMTDESTILPISSLYPDILNQSEISTTNDVLHSTSGSVETTTIAIIADEISSTFQKHQGFSDNYFNINNTENLSSTVSLDELASTDSWEEVNNDGSYYTTPIKDEDAFIETTTNIIHIWLAQESTKNKIEGNVLSTSDKYNEFSSLNSFDYELTTFPTTPKSTNSVDSVTSNIPKISESSATISEIQQTTFETSTNKQLINLGSEETQTSIPLNTILTNTEFLEYTDDHNEYKLGDTEYTFQTPTTSANSTDDATRKPNDSVFAEEITKTSENSTTFKKLDETPFETTTRGLVNLGVDEEDLPEEAQTSTSPKTISTALDILKYTNDHHVYKLNDTNSTYYQAIPSNHDHDAENILETTNETRYRHLKKLTDNFTMDSIVESSTNDAIDETTISNSKADGTTIQQIFIKHEEFLSTEEPNLQNSITDTSTLLDFNEHNENSTIFSKELIDNGQFTADAINILKEDDYETTENIRFIVENLDSNEYTESPVITVTEINTNSFSIVPPLQQFEISDEFEKHPELTEYAITTESVAFSTIKYTTTDTKENKEIAEEIVVNNWDGVNEVSENSEAIEIYESQTSDLQTTSSTILFDVIKTSQNQENIHNITNAAEKDKVTSNLITTTVSNGFNEELAIPESEGKITNNLSNEANTNKITESQENVEDDSTEKELKETSTNQKLLKNTSFPITITEESNEEETEDEETFETEKMKEEFKENVRNDVSSEEDYEEDQDQMHTEEDEFQKDDVITTDTIISSLKELEELDNDALNQTHTAFKVSDELTTSVNSLEDIDGNEALTIPKIHNVEQESFSKYVFKTYIDRTTTERVQTDVHEILSTPDDFEDLLEGENVNNLDHILTDRDAKVNMSAEKVKSWPKISLNELAEEDRNHDIEEKNEKDEVSNVKLAEDVLAKEINENPSTDPASLNYYDEDYTNSEESNSTEVIDSNDENDAAAYLSIMPNRKMNEFCLQGNISLRIFIGEHDIKVPENSQVFVNCTNQGYNLIISWRSEDLETSNSTIFLFIEAQKEEYYIESVEVVHVDTVEAIKSVRSGLMLLTTLIGDTMAGSFTIDFENGYQVEVTDINLRLNQVIDYSDLEQASQAKPIISKMTIIIICTSATSCLVFIVMAIILYRKFAAKTTVYKMTIE